MVNYSEIKSQFNNHIFPPGGVFMKREDFVALALGYLDFPAIKYRGRGTGSDPSGFDCSGFIGFLLKAAAYSQNIPRHVNELFDSFGFLIHEQFVSPGDLVFFSYKGGVYPDHMGMMVSKDEYIHSPGKDGSRICTRKMERTAIEPRTIRDQIYFSNPIGFKRITVRNERYQKAFLED
ncbi:MAG: hypothetical protein UX75_C0008G0015 [Candidatus Moranbacteria bacterium GW2011_GWE2_47_10]|nr:MAG: hypothetical protein UX75_C0008G0015 [Candidatus Moranbacteria bacterium GW2011_GWE2_47_10]